MKAAIYSRKSVYTGKGESVENQIEMCKQYIFSKIQGITEQDITVYEDEGFSAKDTDRPRFQRLLRDVRQKMYDYVICYRLDRISRNVSDFAALIEELNNLGVLFVCIREEFDTSKPMGKAMMFIASVFAQLERETIAERVRDNMFMLARSGRWLGGTPPTGFMSEKTELINIDGKVKSACRLKYNHNEIGSVRTIFEKFLELQSISGVSKYLIANDIKSRTGKYFSLPGIKDLLSNPVYCIADHDAREYFLSRDSDVCFKEEECSDKLGLLSYNKRNYKKRHAPRQAMSEWIVAVGKHNGIVTGKEWVRVQNMLEAKKQGSVQVKAHNGYSLLSGMIYCADCGGKMFAKIRSNNKLFDYICVGKMRGGKKLCGCKNLNGSETDGRVFDCMARYANESPCIYKLLEKLKADMLSGPKEDHVAEIDARIGKCNAEIDKLVSVLAQPDLTPNLVRRVNARAAELSEELERLAASKRRLISELNPVSDMEMQLDKLANSLSGLRAYFKELTVQEKRQFIRIMIQKIEWDGEDLHIFIYDGYD